MMLRSMLRYMLLMCHACLESEDDHLRLRVAVCRSLLRTTARIPGDSYDSQFGLPSANRWPNYTSKADLEGSVTILHNGTPRELG
jgi:hypothetical protein